MERIPNDVSVFEQVRCKLELEVLHLCCKATTAQHVITSSLETVGKDPHQGFHHRFGLLASLVAAAPITESRMSPHAFSAGLGTAVIKALQENGVGW